MARNPETVNAFLEALRSRLTVKGRRELEDLKTLKRTDSESRGESFDGCFYPWDWEFYRQITVKQRYSYERLKTAEYFPLQSTIKGMLKNFEHLFGLEFQDVTQNTDSWHEDVQVYSVWDVEELGSGFLGYLYLDLYTRDGEASSAFNLNLQPVFMTSMPSYICSNI